jgi:hypothetical protein
VTKVLNITWITGLPKGAEFDRTFVTEVVQNACEGAWKEFTMLVSTATKGDLSSPAIFTAFDCLECKRLVPIGAIQDSTQKFIDSQAKYLLLLDSEG